MKKLILISLILIACSKKSVETKESFTDSISLDTVNMIEKTEAALQHTEGLETQIKETYKTKEILLKENNTLKQEIQIIKDSLVAKENQLAEVKKKLPKKKNLIEKVFNIGPDSIEVVEKLNNK